MEVGHHCEVAGIDEAYFLRHRRLAQAANRINAAAAMAMKRTVMNQLVLEGACAKVCIAIIATSVYYQTC
jgi:isochorismate hydrolase